MTALNKLIVATGVLVAILVFIQYNNEYTKEKPVRCIILEKDKTEAGYRQSALYIFVLKSNKDTFYTFVSPSSYHTHKKGYNIVLLLSQDKINPTRKQDILFIYLPLLIGSLIITGCVLILILYLHNIQNNNQIIDNVINFKNK